MARIEAKNRGQNRVADRTAELAATNDAIRRFVPREFLHALGHDDVTTTKLGDATARSITVLFADIRNFTSSSEGMSPEETFAFLNGCLSKLGPHVRAQSGFVDKYIGDAIMALFPRDPSDAVRAAIAMQEELRRTNEEAGGRVPLAIGVGVHVGRVMMGTIGEAERFEATVISDAVNLTARLESLTKQLGCAVLISEEVHATLGADVRAHTRRLGTFLVKGKAQAVTLHEVFASDAAALREAKIRTRAVTNRDRRPRRQSAKSSSARAISRARSCKRSSSSGSAHASILCRTWSGTSTPRFASTRSTERMPTSTRPLARPLAIPSLMSVSAMVMAVSEASGEVWSRSS